MGVCFGVGGASVPSWAKGVRAMGFRHLDHSLSPPTSRGNIGGHDAPTRSPPRPPRPQKVHFSRVCASGPSRGRSWGRALRGWRRGLGDGAWPRAGRRGLRGRGRVNCIEVAAPVHSGAVQSRGSNGAPRVHLLPPLMGWTKLPRKSPPSALDTAPHHVPALQGPRLRPWPRAPATTGQQGPTGAAVGQQVRSRPVPGQQWWQQGQRAHLVWAGSRRDE